MTGNGSTGRNRTEVALWSRLSGSFWLAVGALCPGVGRDGWEVLDRKGPALEVTPARLRQLRGGLFRRPDQLLDPDGELRLFFPGALALTAPLLLFRLKRTGFSGCRAETCRAGILLLARR